MQLLKLTNEFNNSFWVNPEHITSIDLVKGVEKDDRGNLYNDIVTSIGLSNGLFYLCTELPATIFKRGQIEVKSLY